MPSGIKLKWTGKKYREFAQKNNVNKTEKAGSFIHKAIYSSEATVAEEKKNVRGKKNTLNLLNSTIQQRWLSSRIMHPCVITAIFWIVFTCLYIVFLVCLCRRVWRDAERPFQKKAEHSWEVKKSERLCAGLWMQPSQFGLTLLPFLCGRARAACARLPASVCVYAYACVPAAVCACVCSDWPDKCGTPLRCCEWSD